MDTELQAARRRVKLDGSRSDQILLARTLLRQGLDPLAEQETLPLFLPTLETKRLPEIGFEELKDLPASQLRRAFTERQEEVRREPFGGLWRKRMLQYRAGDKRIRIYQKLYWQIMEHVLLPFEKSLGWSPIGRETTHTFSTLSEDGGHAWFEATKVFALTNQGLMLRRTIVGDHTERTSWLERVTYFVKPRHVTPSFVMDICHGVT